MTGASWALLAAWPFLIFAGLALGGWLSRVEYRELTAAVTQYRETFGPIGGTAPAALASVGPVPSHAEGR